MAIPREARIQPGRSTADGVGMQGSNVFRIAAVLLWIGIVPVLHADEGDDQFSVAARHYARGRWQPAADEFRVVLDKFADHPRAPGARFFLGETLVQLESYAEARRLFAAFLQLSPEHPHAAQARFRMGEIAYLMNDDVAARQDLEQFREKHPEHPLNAFAIPHLAAVALRNSEAAAARDLYSESLQRFPDHPLADSCRLGLGRALVELDEPEEAMRFFELLAGQQKNPLAADARLRIGMLQHRQQKYSEAIASLEGFDKAYPDSGLRTQAAYWLGLSQLSANQPQRAAETLAHAAQLDPAHALMPAIEFASGEALRLAGTPDQAEAHYQRVAHDWPLCRWADDSLQILVEVAFGQQQYDRVEVLATEFSERFGDSPLAPLVEQMAGRALLKQERYPEAAAAFRRAIEHPALEQSANPSDSSQVNDRLESLPEPDSKLVPEAVKNSSWYYLALARLGAQEFQLALEALDKTQADDSQRELQQGLCVARGAALIGLARYTDAIDPLEQYLQLSPDGDDAPTCRAQLALALAHTGKFAAARSVYDRLGEKSRNNPIFFAATLHLAEVAFTAGEREMATDWFQALTKDDVPDEYREQGLAGLAWTQAGSQDPQSSIATFERLLADRPDSPLASEAALGVAKAHEQLQHFPEALTAYDRVLTRYRDSKQFASSLFGAARVQEKLGQPEQAVQLLERLIKEQPAYPRIDAALYELGWLLFELGRIDESNATFERLANEHPDSEFWADATYRLAERAARTQQNERARELVERLVQSKSAPDVVCHALYLQGQLAASDKRWADVAAPMQRVVDEFPDSALRLSAQYWLAEACYQQHDYPQAQSRFADVARDTLGRTDAWMGMIPLRQAQLLSYQGDWQGAYELAAGIRRRFEDFRQLFEVDYVLGRCLAAQGRFQDAREAYQRVIQSPAGGKSETAAMAQWMIGETHLHQKRYDEAIRAFHRVESLFDYPRWQAAALLQAGKCHEARQEWTQASGLYKQLLDEFSETEFAGEAAERLRAARGKINQQARMNRGRAR